MARTLERVETTAALDSGSAPLPSLPQPRARALPFLLGSGPIPFEATRQPSKGPPKTEDLRLNPLTGTSRGAALSSGWCASTRRVCRAASSTWAKWPTRRRARLPRRTCMCMCIMCTCTRQTSLRHTGRHLARAP